jgi:long-chain acyl-CoA synthetase
MKNTETMPWLKSYPSGLSQAINVDKYSSLAALIEACLEKYSSLTAYENMRKTLSYKELGHLSQAFASYLINHLGMKQGERIAIQLPNILQYPIALLGSIRAGLTIVNLNPFYTPYEMEAHINDANVTCIIVLANFADKLEKILKNTSIKHVIITEIGDLLGFAKRMVVNFIAKNIKKIIPPYNIKGKIQFNDAIKKGAELTFIKPKIKSEEVAFIQYTGSTTGKAKGVMLTNRNILASIEQTSAWVLTKLKEGEEIIITPLPVYHIFALTINVLTAINIGGKNVFITNPRSINTFISELKRHKFTIITGVNTLFKLLLSSKNFKTIDFTHCKVCLGGGMPMEKAIVEEWQEITRKPLIEGYGLTEASPVIACSPLNNDHVIGTVGLPLPNTMIRIVDEDGNDLETGQAGELLAKGPQIMKEYLNNDEETQKTIIDGWLKTGDIATMDQNGFIKIIDRKKDMINVSGFNVYPREIEIIIDKHPKVLESAVIGIKDTKTGESIKAFIVKKDNSLEKQEIIEHCTQYLTTYKMPKYVEFIDTLPKSTVGKVMKKDLKQST